MIPHPDTTPPDLWASALEREVDDSIAVPVMGEDWRLWARQLREAAGDVLEVPEEQSFGSFAAWASEFIRDNWQG